MATEKKITAYWECSLDVECPHCKELFDCMKVPDYYIDVLQEVKECVQKDNLDISMLCPHCGKEFKINETLY